MRAIVCHEYGPVSQLRFHEDWPAPVPGPGQVRIGVRAASMNFADALKVAGRYQVKTPLPFIPGTEVSGQILEVAPDVTNVRVGDRVVCIMTHACGGWSEQLVLDARRLLLMPAAMSYAEGASFPSAYGTSMHALRQRGELKDGETLLVLGAAGGVGLAAVQLGRAMGARVIAAASSKDKLEITRRHGAHDTINYSQERLRDAVNRLTDGRGADVVYDPVGGDLFEEALHCTAWLGRLLIVGFASGRIPTVKTNLALLKGYDLRGVRFDTWRDRTWDACIQNYQDMLAWYEQGKLRLELSASYRLEQAVEAMTAIEERKTLGKQVFILD
ncbi:MAG: NADPH:quinone oxidoreductase family protein [Burkholderiaceae bacterium]|nr:NADPH:quinone oxidoreductase family protein [Burkholderiaceae bacterium]